MMIGPPLLLLSLLMSASRDTALDQDIQAESFLFGEQTIVSAARHEEPLSKSPSAMTVITGDELMRQGSLIAALRSVPGLDVQGFSPSMTALNIRSNADLMNYPVLIVIDGRKMTVDILGVSLIEALPVVLEDIERIEIIRGPGSALYGAALSGVINIITKDPKDTEGFLARVSSGSFNTNAVALRAAGRAGNNVRARVSVMADSADDFVGAYTARKSLSAGSRIVYSPSPSFSLDAQAGIAGTRAAAYVDIVQVGYDILEPYAILSVSARGDDQEVHAQVYYDRIEGTMSIPFIDNVQKRYGQVFGPRFQSLDYLHIPETENTYDVEAYYSPFTRLHHNRLTIGAQGRYANAETPMGIESHIEEAVAAVYLQDEYTPTDALSILVGGRYDFNTESRPSVSPRASVVVTPGGGHTLRASYGESFRKPSFLENQFRLVGLSEGPLLGFNVPFSNPDMKNQKQTTFEAGYRWTHARVRAFVDGYYTIVRDRFYFHTDRVYQFSNDSREDLFYGGEAGGEVLVVPDVLRFLASYSHIQGTDIGGLEAANPGQRHSAAAGADLTIAGRVRIHARVNYVDARKVSYLEPSLEGLLRGVREKDLDPYVLVNGGITYAITRPGVDIGVTVVNALDEAAYDYPRMYSSTAGYYGGERQPRTFFGFLRAAF